ncbi:MAG: DUF3737 family protein [Acholeplasmatales bacterium]|nr:DUF3737 family protein [Acholeplasmatales bacterium]
MTLIENNTYDEERSLYNLCDTKLNNCTFSGPNDGESPLKECRNIIVKNSTFNLRYPLWHDKGFSLISSILYEPSRAPLWYSFNGIIEDTKIESVKALRECDNIKINNSFINSKEFGWKCNDIVINNSNIESEYMLFDSKNIKIDKLTFSGKYSFQYINKLYITNSILDTKDAFWHSENVEVKDSTIKGEYLGWFSKNLKLINCKIIGTQPFCYCENLELIDCEMIDCDFAFEYSSVNAKIKGNVISIKNPKSGHITVDSVDKIINDNSIMENNCIIDILNK